MPHRTGDSVTGYEATTGDAALPPGVRWATAAARETARPHTRPRAAATD
ncbi:hypothetical protein ACIP4Y_10100 [Streptomyces sp. NPDC088810]